MIRDLLIIFTLVSIAFKALDVVALVLAPCECVQEAQP